MGMIQRCRVSGEQFEIADADYRFFDKVCPTVGGVALHIPPPTISPDERQRRRLAFRNERYLYRRSCAISGKPVVSIYSPDADLKVVAKDEWLKVDNLEFGRAFDFSRPFFEQFGELYRATFKASIIQAGEMFNSEFANFCGWLKNCYLLFDSGKSEDCMYGVFNAYCRNCFDSMYLSRCELCYESVKLENCYATHYSAYSKNCSNSAYLESCIGCKNCLGCTNLRNKEYYFFNRPVSPVMFKQLWNELFSGGHAAQLDMQRRFRVLLLEAPRKANRNLNCEECEGDDLVRCQNVQQSFNCMEAKDCRYCYDIYLKTSDCQDVGTFGEQMQYCYEVGASGGTIGLSEVSNLFFCNYIYYGGCNIFYSSHLHENCQDIFGCCDLRKKQYCILNKQYSKDEYEALVPKIVEHMRSTGEWGEFFPMALSPFGYNQSLAAEFYPETEERAKALGARWTGYSAPAPVAKNVLTESELDGARMLPRDELLERAVLCAATGRPFKLKPQELQFVLEQGLPLPRFHPEERHRQRQWWFNPRRIWQRVCEGCAASVHSSFSPERAEHIFCESCYAERTD